MNATDPIEVAFSERTGRIEHFDDVVGAGTVRDDDGAEWWFHCTSIADGTRTIEAGAPVRFEVVPAPTGLEAVGITPLRRAS